MSTGGLLQLYWVFTGWVALLSLFAVVHGISEHEPRATRWGARSFLLSPAWPLTVIVLLIAFLGWIGVKAFGEDQT